MSRIAHSTWATYAKDKVAQAFVSRLRDHVIISEHLNLAPDARAPLGSVLVIHRPEQEGYITVEGTYTTFRVYVREPRGGKDTRRFKKSIKRVPVVLEKRAAGRTCSR